MKPPCCRGEPRRRTTGTCPTPPIRCKTSLLSSPFLHGSVECVTLIARKGKGERLLRRMEARRRRESKACSRRRRRRRCRRRRQMPSLLQSLHALETRRHSPHCVRHRDETTIFSLSGTLTLENHTRREGRCLVLFVAPGRRVEKGKVRESIRFPFFFSAISLSLESARGIVAAARKTDRKKKERAFSFLFPSSTCPVRHGFHGAGLVRAPAHREKGRGRR